MNLPLRLNVAHPPVVTAALTTLLLSFTVPQSQLAFAAQPCAQMHAVSAAALIQAGSTHRKKRRLRLRWKSGTETFRPMNQFQVRQAFISLSARKPTYPGALPPRHVVVQFDRSIKPAERDQLEANGIKLLSYLSDHAHFAAIGHKILDPTELARCRPLKGVRAIKRKWKLGHMLRKRKIPPYAVLSRGNNLLDPNDDIVAVFVQFHQDVPLRTEAQDIINRYEATIRCTIAPLNFVGLNLPRGELLKFCAEDAVQWVQLVLPRMEPQ